MPITLSELLTSPTWRRRPFLLLGVSGYIVTEALGIGRAYTSQILKAATGPLHLLHQLPSGLPGFLLLLRPWLNSVPSERPSHSPSSHPALFFFSAYLLDNASTYLAFTYIFFSPNQLLYPQPLYPSLA